MMSLQFTFFSKINNVLCNHFGNPQTIFCVWSYHVFNRKREISLIIHMYIATLALTAQRVVKWYDNFREFFDFPRMESAIKNLLVIRSSGTYQFPISKKFWLINLTPPFWLIKYASMITFVFQVKKFRECKLRAYNYWIIVYVIRSTRKRTRYKLQRPR